MKRFRKFVYPFLSALLIFILIGCSGAFFSESWSSIIGCIFYGDCDYLFNEYYTEFQAVEGNEGIQLEGSWAHVSTQAGHTYQLHFYTDNRIELLQLNTGNAEVLRRDRGYYLATDEKITFSMENGTRSVVDYMLSEGKLILSVTE